MDLKAFLQYLLQEKLLTQEQVSLCVEEVRSKKIPLPQVILQHQFCTPPLLKQWISDFQQPKTLVQVLENSSPQEAVSNVLERYEVLEVLGEGGMGVVERVKDQLLKREVALKRIKLPSGSTQKLARAQRVLLWRFRREASITAILEHPNIIPLHDMQQKRSGELYFTMRKVEGETLSKKLRKKRANQEALEEHKILSIYLKICDAISYAHSRGVVHRDLKPDNIMLGKFGEVYVMDWGIAKLIGESSEDLEQEIDSGSEISNGEGLRTMGGMGTPGYMAPEQAKNASFATAQSDIYALGKILRECYTLLSPQEEKKMQLSTSDQKMKEIESFISDDVLAIIEKATQEEAEHRYESVQKIAEDIDAYLQHRAVSVRQYSLWELCYKWIQRNKMISLLILMICGVSLLFYGYSSFQKKRERSLVAEKFYSESQKEQKEADQNSLENRQEKSKKLKHLLNALNNLNRSLQINPDRPKIQTEKLELCHKLFDLACNNQQYLLAYSIAQELEKQEGSKDKKIKQLKERQEKILLEHQNRLEIWIKKLKPSDALRSATRKKDDSNGLGTTASSTLKGFELEDAIYEISRMKEREILDKLLEIMNEGTNYYLSESGRFSLMDEFYVNIVEILRRLSNPASGAELIASIKIFIEKNPRKPFIFSDIRYLKKMISALGNTKSPQYAEDLKKYCLKLGEGFWKEVESDYKKLLSED